MSVYVDENVPAPDNRPALASALDRADKAAGALEELVGLLAAKLELVLQPERPSEPSDVLKSVGPPVSASVSRLVQHCERLDRTYYRLSGIMDRLDT